MTNRTKLTDKRQKTFMEVLRESCNVSLAARTVGMSRAYMYEYRDANPEFAKQWDNAIEEATDTLEQEARRRASDGFDEPVFHNGKQCGTKRRYSDTLMVLLLKAHRPDKFTERLRTEQHHIGATLIIDGRCISGEDNDMGSEKKYLTEDGGTTLVIEGRDDDPDSPPLIRQAPDPKDEGINRGHKPPRLRDAADNLPEND